MKSNGEMDLAKLLATMTPVLADGIYGFATVDEMPANVEPLMTFRETEGITLILPWDAAGDVVLEFPCRMITLNVHSALEAVGFIAAIATRLAAAGMGVNPVAGFYHDHLFVPADRAQDAMAILQEIATGAC